ncbi:phage integrase N-terminal SAM-like domain-containing protein, partial [Escherichia coli]|uniref:phage integrase N-terminal SAM-like domain-containing protein n=1 Tax=Escherichia coli TaxID=562 RepID=UPI000B9F0249
MKTATAPLPPLRSVKVLDQLRERIRYLHYSLPTEQAYVHWVRAFIRFHGVRHPATLGSSEVEAFLSWLANERKVSGHCCKVSDEAAFCLIQRPYISKTLLT